MSRPPSTAPGKLPIPPTTAAMNAYRPATNPMYGHTCWYASPLKTPAAPASAEPMKNVATITRSTSMPIIAAASRSNDVARMALPSCDRWTNSVRQTISTIVPATTITWATPTWTPAGSVNPFTQSSLLCQP